MIWPNAVNNAMYYTYKGSMLNIPKIPTRYRPRGFQILHEDLDVIVGNKSAGFLTVEAKWEKHNTIHNILNAYVRRGNVHSKKCVYVVHRLDLAASGVLIFAKNLGAQFFLKRNWKSTEKVYFAIVHGKMPKKTGLISSFLREDEDCVVHSSRNCKAGKLSETEYSVVHHTQQFSVLRIKLLTGRRNQIRVHLAGEGCPIVGDTRYGKDTPDRYKNLMLHSFSLVFTHPFSKRRVRIQADVPDYFKQLVPYSYCRRPPLFSQSFSKRGP